MVFVTCCLPLAWSLPVKTNWKFTKSEGAWTCCEATLRLSHVKLQVFQWCCTVIALLLHPHKQVNGNYISINYNTQGQSQGQLSFAFISTVYICALKPTVVLHTIKHSDAFTKYTLKSLVAKYQTTEQCIQAGVSPSSHSVLTFDPSFTL